MIDEIVAEEGAARGSRRVIPRMHMGVGMVVPLVPARRLGLAEPEDVRRDGGDDPVRCRGMVSRGDRQNEGENRREHAPGKVGRHVSAVLPRGSGSN